jgi:short-subunit dehydrogenase
MTDTQSTPLAVVTGASSGIGLELAKQFAENGFDLLINAEGLRSVRRRRAAECRRRPRRGRPSRPRLLQRRRADLRRDPGDRAAGQCCRAERRDRPGGAFVDTDLTDELRLIDLNVRSTVHLAKRLLPDMVDQGEGKVLITSSIASTMPGSFQAVYNASKSFVQSFALALQEELKDSGVTITSLMPGPTETNFFARADMADTAVGQSSKDDAAQVAKQGYEALMAGKSRSSAGR